MINATSLATMQEKERLRVLEALDREYAYAIELKRREQDALQLEQPIVQSRHIAYASAFPLRQYIREAFPYIEQGVEYQHNWHIDIVTEILTSATIGDIRNFIINIPRRTMKSLLICVFWQTWVWTFLPSLRWLYTSYTANFAKRDNEKCQALIQSPYYQQRWGAIVKLTTQRRDKIANTAGGFRAVFKIGKGVGEGGDIVIADDPNDILETESDTVLESTNQGYTEISYHNVTNRNTAIRGVVQQRTNQNDLTGHLLEKEDLRKQYVHLCLPMRFEEDHPDTNTPSRPVYLGKVNVYDKANHPELEVGSNKLWIDPRCKEAPNYENTWYQFWYKKYFTSLGLTSKGEGQLLWENYITENVVQQDVAHLGVYGEASQFQQRPNMRGGNFFKSKDFLDEKGKALNPDLIDYNNMKFCRFWDKAGSEGEGDWTVGMLIGITPKTPYKLYIIDIIRKQVGYYERMELMKTTAEQDTINYVENYDNTEYSIGIEKEGGSSGKDVATLEKDYLLGYDVFIEIPRGKKAQRAMLPKNISESGRLKVLKGNWNTGFLQRLEKFDKNKTNNVDDEIDTMSGACRKLVFSNKKRRGSSSGRG